MNKYQEAFKRIIWLLEKLADWNGYDLSDLDEDYNYVEDEKKVIELLEKATPKKPSSLEENKYSCPSCSMAFKLRTSVKNMFVNNQYCDVCGQAIDWSGEDEKVT